MQPHLSKTKSTGHIFSRILDVKEIMTRCAISSLKRHCKTHLDSLQVVYRIRLMKNGRNNSHLSRNVRGMILFTAGYFLLAPSNGCGTADSEKRMRREMDEIRLEMTRITDRQNSLEQRVAQLTVAQHTAKEEERKKFPALETKKSMQVSKPTGNNTSSFKIPDLPVVKYQGEGALSEEVVEKENPVSAAETFGIVDAASEIEARNLFSEASKRYAENNCIKAIPLLDAFVGKYYSHPKASLALFNMAECYYKRGEYAVALSEFTRLEQQYPTAKQVPMAAFKLGMCLKQLKDFSGAREVFERVKSSYSGDEAASLAERELKKIKK